ncbi:MAG TPA: hypothetical protein VL201_01175, partial [Patescibacteria group bacterium]|nr:hypothetical protein [Patescibacteria group bacterium]
MKYMILLFAVVSTIIPMEQQDNNDFSMVFPFYIDQSMSPNAIDEIIELTKQNDSGPLYRIDDPENLIRVDSFKGKNDKKNDKNVSQQMAFDGVLGSIPFKSSIHCGIGYTTLLTVALDKYFSYYSVLNGKQIRVGQINNVTNMYYIISLLQYVSGALVVKEIEQLHKAYTKNILLPNTIAQENYQFKMENVVPKNAFDSSKIFFTRIEKLIIYENKDLFYECCFLKPSILEPLMHLLLYLSVFLRAHNTENIIAILSSYKNDLLTHADETKSVVKSRESMNRAFEKLFFEIKQYNNLNNQELLKENDQKKCSLLHDFLFVLNQYVYELILVPAAKKDGGHNFINNKSEQVKKRKT